MSRVLRVALPLVLAVLSLVLVRQNRALREQLKVTVRTATRPHSGLTLPSITLPTLTGGPTQVGQASPGRFQVIFAFTQTCEFCRASYPVIDSIAERLTADTSRRTDVLGVMLDQKPEDASKFMVDVAPPYPVTVLPARWQKLYRFTAVPVVVLVDSTGTVLYAHVGTMQSPGAVDSLYEVLDRQFLPPPTPTALVSP